jgi:subtilisin family serine protease
MSRSSWSSVLVASAGAVALAVVAAGGRIAHGAAATQAGAAQTFVVLAPEGESAARASARVGAAGGTVVARYDAIGVVVARSGRPDFATAVVGDGVESAAATTGLDIPLDPGVQTTAGAPDPATTNESLWALQWNMRAIKVAEAHSITTGSVNVVVGVLDTGIDANHFELASQVDHSRSASCVTGVADPAFAAWQPTGNDHGTHVAGTIAAARNGIGVVGVAPGVRLAAVKLSDGAQITLEAILCGIMWAADHHFDVTNNSYGGVSCRNDASQRPAWIAQQRALRYSNSQGVLTVTSAGNSQYDLQHLSVPTETGTTTNACVILPAEAAGVVTVSATGPTGLKSYYSNYGLGVVEVAAPGGDAYSPGSETVTGGFVLSAEWPGGGLGYKQGTSMAAPHVAGVAALVRSVKPQLSPAQVATLLQRTADPQPCPGFAYTPPGFNVVTQYCYGSRSSRPLKK